MPLTPDRAEFFVREAGEYLARMTPVLAGDTLSAPDELVRLARALRGATMMAGPPGLLRAATALESVAKALQGGNLSWEETVREEVREARDTFETLVIRTLTWGDEDRLGASRMAQALEGLAGATPTSPTPRTSLPPSGPTPEGVRRFVMREAARIARSTEDLLTTAGAPTPESLRGVLDRMHAIRGLALPAHFHALTLVLECLETLLGDLLRGYPPPPDLGPILTTATLGLLRGAAGNPSEELPADVARLGELACAAFAEERDVVPIEHLLLDPVPSEAREAEAPLPPPDPVDLVSLGDRLHHMASQLRTPDRAVLPFHIHSLAAMLRSLRAVADRDPAGPAVRAIARAIRGGGALADPDAFASALLALAQPLTAAATITREDVARDLALAATLLPQGGALAPPPPPADAPSPVPLAPAFPAATVPSALVEHAGSPAMGPPPAADHSSSASPAEGTIVPIATLLLPPDPMARTPFEVSFSTLHRRRHGMDQVTAAGSPDAPVVPGAPTTPGDVAAIVPIEELLYRGDAALGRLGEIQAVLKTLRSPAPAPETLSALLDECLDLIPLALDVTH